MDFASEASGPQKTKKIVGKKCAAKMDLQLEKSSIIRWVCGISKKSLPQCIISTHIQTRTTNRLLSAHEKLAVCDVTNLPYLDINWQSMSIYGNFLTSLSAYYSCAEYSGPVITIQYYNMIILPIIVIHGNHDNT